MGTTSDMPKVSGLGPLERPKDGVFINSKLLSAEDFRLGESCRETWETCEENLRRVPELVVSLGDDPNAGLGLPPGPDRGAEDWDILEGGRGSAMTELEIFSRGTLLGRFLGGNAGEPVLVVNSPKMSGISRLLLLEAS